jgi:Holliday junction resolvase
MTHPSKVKGNGFERELVQFFTTSGIPAKRAYASNGEALGHHASVDVVAAGKRLQAKRKARIAIWMKPSENQDAVVFREDRGQTYVCITLAEYANLLKQTEK